MEAYHPGPIQEHPAATVAAGVAHAVYAPQRWGLSAEAVCTLGKRLEAFWERCRRCCKTCTRDTSAHACTSRRGQLTMDTERHLATSTTTRVRNVV